MSGVDESVRQAFGLRPVSTVESAAVDAAASAFGRPVPSEDALRRDLIEAGYTESGARYVMENLAMGWSAERSVATPFDSQVQNGKVHSLVEGRGLEVLSRHGKGATERVQEASDDTAAAGRVGEARSRLLEAHQAAWPGSSVRSSQIYADTAVKVRLESAARNGWSTDQIVEALDEQAKAEGRRATDARQDLAESKRRTVREAGR